MEKLYTPRTGFTASRSWARCKERGTKTKTIIFHIVTPLLPHTAPHPHPISDSSYVFYALHERTIFTMKRLHSKADSCFNQSRARSEVTVERSVLLLRIAIANLGPQPCSITPSKQAACSSASQKILRVLRNSMVHYLVHNSPPLSLYLVRPKTPIPVTGTVILILSCHLRLSLPSVSFQQTSPSNRCIHLSLSSYVPHFPLS